MYIVVAMPSLFFFSMYYLHLRQKELNNQIYKLRLMPGVRALFWYKQCLSQYASLITLLDSTNKFWAFYLWMYLAMTPVLSTYLLFVVFFRKLDLSIWWMIYSVGAVYCITNLILIVFFSSRVGHNNHVLTKDLGDIYWWFFMTGKINQNIQRHHHFESCMQAVRRSNYYITTLDYQNITNRTFLVLLLKFGFVFFKLIANSHFHLERKKSSV